MDGLLANSVAEANHLRADAVMLMPARVIA